MKDLCGKQLLLHTILIVIGIYLIFILQIKTTESKQTIPPHSTIHNVTILSI